MTKTKRAWKRGKIGKYNNFLCTLCTVRMPNEFKCRSFHSKCKRNKRRKKNEQKKVWAADDPIMALDCVAQERCQLTGPSKISLVKVLSWHGNGNGNEMNAHTQSVNNAHTMHKWIVITCVCVCRLLRLSLNGLL